jgi:predicted metal-dependent hydrolase
MPDTSITIQVPYFFPKSKIESVLREKDAWIQQHVQVVKTRTAARESETYLYLGKSYPLEIRQSQKNIVEISDKLYIASPSKKYVKNYLTSWYKQQARKIIIGRVHYYSSLSGLKFKSVNLTSAQTRWGSCSSEKNLNFNWRLIMSPLAVIDYVVAHELAHLVELNHSRSFWETVRKMFPLYRQYRTWLKRNGDSLRV